MYVTGCCSSTSPEIVVGEGKGNFSFGEYCCVYESIKGETEV